MAVVHDGKVGPMGTTARCAWAPRHPPALASVAWRFTPQAAALRLTRPRLLHRCRVELDEDVPGHGKNFCVTCSRYFVSPAALGTHGKTKEHRRRIKNLEGPKPHNQGDADWAGGMGAPDNGARKEAAMAVDS